MTGSCNSIGKEDREGGGVRVGVAGVEAVVNETRPRVGSGVDRERVVRQMKRV